MMRSLNLGFIIACSIVMAVAAKTPTVKLTIAGPRLANAIDVTNPKALANVWEGSFIKSPATEPDKALPRYLVSFFTTAPRGESGPKMCYVVYYVRDPQSGEGYVYLPGRGEEWHRLNVGSILRNGQDGKWHLAEKTWSDAVAAALP
jgi:hypothetical protein